MLNLRLLGVPPNEVSFDCSKSGLARLSFEWRHPFDNLERQRTVDYIQMKLSADSSLKFAPAEGFDFWFDKAAMVVGMEFLRNHSQLLKSTGFIVTDGPLREPPFRRVSISQQLALLGQMFCEQYGYQFGYGNGQSKSVPFIPVWVDTPLLAVGFFIQGSTKVPVQNFFILVLLH